jgi:hypothetical protein
MEVFEFASFRTKRACCTKLMGEALSLSRDYSSCSELFGADSGFAAPTKRLDSDCSLLLFRLIGGIDRGFLLSPLLSRFLSGYLRCLFLSVREVWGETRSGSSSYSNK